MTMPAYPNHSRASARDPSVAEMRAELDAVRLRNFEIERELAAPVKLVEEQVTEALGEVALARVMGQSVHRCRDMQAIADAVDHVEWHPTLIVETGRTIMVPMAVMRDGRRLTKAELRATLRLSGAIA